MTDNITFPLTDEMITTLFNEGRCLTFQWPQTANILKDIPKPQETPKHKRYRCCSKTATLYTINSHFHYFDNGILICAANTTPTEVERFCAILKARKLPLIKKYNQMSSLDYYNINRYAVTHYDHSDATYKPYIEYAEEIEDLFANGNICLTACQDENIDPMWRKHIAVFSDGRCIQNTHPNFVYNTIHDFTKKYPDYICLNGENCTNDILEQIYQKASEYPWYSSPKEAKQKYLSAHPTLQISAKEQARIQEIITDNICMTVDGGKILFNAPDTPPLVHKIVEVDRHKYALFADGQLIIAASSNEDKTQAHIKYLQQNLTEIYPHLTFKPEVQSEQFVKELYKALLKTQPSACDIYCEQLKTIARKIKQKLHVSHTEALEICAHAFKFKNWHEVTTINEQQARFLIHRLKLNQFNFKYYNGDLSIRIIILYLADKFKSVAEYQTAVHNLGLTEEELEKINKIPYYTA